MTTGHDPWDDRGEMPDPDYNPFYGPEDDYDIDPGVFGSSLDCPHCGSPDTYARDIDPSGEGLDLWMCRDCGGTFYLER